MVSLCGVMEDPDMGADTTKPGADLTQAAFGDLRTDHSAEKRAGKRPCRIA